MSIGCAWDVSDADLGSWAGYLTEPPARALLVWMCPICIQTVTDRAASAPAASWSFAEVREGTRNFRAIPKEEFGACSLLVVI